MTEPKKELTLAEKIAKLSPAPTTRFYLGCDPEFFFRDGNKIIGSEKIFDPEGLVNNTPSLNDRCVLAGSVSKFVIDGVQAELNPRPNTCRANLANEIAACFKTLRKEIKAKNDGVAVDFRRTIKITKAELKKLDEKSQKFGCMPSHSAHKDTSTKLTEVDPLEYRNRSAGGHIHIGTQDIMGFKSVLEKAPDDVVKLLDIICGNTCVLIDRDEGNIERRKLYGRAGEYRLPAHGLEYRTLSNFWLTDYHLMSLAFGLARMAVSIGNNDALRASYLEAFLESVSMEDIQNAINNNDYELARKNFDAIKPILLRATQGHGSWMPFDQYTMEAFEFFVDTVQTDGLERWFKTDPMEHWCDLPEAHADGIYAFLSGPVAKELKAKKQQGQPVA